jgi:ParB-like chromosome segregation protein Spo0J
MTTTLRSTAGLVPRHPVRDRAKRDQIAADLGERGWVGRPLLGVQAGEDSYVLLLTGSHRYAAATMIGLDKVPVHVMDAEEIGWTIDGEDVRDEDGQRLVDDDELLAALRRAGDETAVALMDKEGSR